MIRFEIDNIIGDDSHDGIKHFEMKGTHEKVIEECGMALYCIIYGFEKQYKDIEDKTGYIYIGNVREYFKNIMDLAELNAAGFHYDYEKGDLSEDEIQKLDSLFDNCLVFLSESEKEPPEIDKLFMDVRYKNPNPD